MNNKPIATILTSPIFIETAAVAMRMHDRQTRKYYDEPYWFHPMRVAAEVAKLPYATPMMAAAAVGHDLFEDTSCDGMTLFAALASCQMFRSQDIDTIIKLIGELTNPSKKHTHLDRWAKKLMDRQHIAGVSYEAKSIKMIDRMDNLQSIPCGDSFLEVYVPESRLLLDAIRMSDDYDVDLARNMQAMVESFQ